MTLETHWPRLLPLALTGAALAGCAGLHLTSMPPAPAQSPRANASPAAPTVSPEEFAQDVLGRQHAAPGLDTCGFKVFDALVSAAATENVAVSPSSLGRTLLMAYFGARGATRDAIASSLGMSDQSDQTVADWVDASGPSLELNGVAIGVADSAWIKDGFSVLPGFVTDLTNRFGAEVGSFTNGADGTAKIAAWIAKASHGLLDGAGLQIDDSAALSLADVTTFDGRWDTVFDKAATQLRPFYPSSSQTIQVPTMAQSGEYSYAEAAGYQIVRLPYQHSVYSMYVVEASDSATASFDEPLFEQLVGQMASGPGEILLPRFSFTQSKDLTSALKAIGLGQAFSPAADFGGIAPNLELSDAWQQVHVAVDETGTVAAAATVITAVGSGYRQEPPPFTMAVDRPFYFAIRDDSSNVVLFVGRVVNPQ